MTFTEFLQSRDLSTLTVSGYLSDLHSFQKWFLKQNGEVMTINNFTPTDIRDYRAALIKSDRAPASIARQLATIRILGEYGIAIGAIEVNPATGLRGVRQQKHAPKWLDKQAQSRLMREVEKDKSLARTDPARWAAKRNFAIMSLLINTGLRVSELVSLRIINIELAPRSGKLKILGKGQKYREIPLNHPAREALRDWLDGATSPEARPFVLSRQAIFAIVAEYGHRAGLDLSPHILRHTFAKNLVDSGVPLDQVAMLLGHARLETTRIYTIPGERDLEMAVERLEM